MSHSLHPRQAADLRNHIVRSPAFRLVYNQGSIHVFNVTKALNGILKRVFSLDSIGREIRPMLGLAAPLVVAELGWMAMSVVDTMMVGRLPNSAVAIGATSLGGIVYYTCTVYGGSVLLGLDTMVSQAFGAGRLRDCHKSLWPDCG
jgi:Na+-driven multidrug efflux pump